MALTFRRDLSRNLTAAEADGNIDDLNGRLVIVEAGTGSGGISSITLSGSVITFHFTDSSTMSIDIGTANAYVMGDHVKGVWQAGIAYVVNDIFYYQGSLYCVIYDHTSAGTFDENATSAGHDVYKLIVRYGEGVITVTGSTFTPNSSHANKYIRCTNSGGCVITLNSGVFVPADRMTFRQCGAGGLIFDGPTSVTINVIDGCEPATTKLGSVVTVFAVGASEFDIFGLLLTTTGF